MSLLFEEYLDPKDVDWDMHAPCADCPFRRDAPDHAGICAAIPSYFENIEAGRFAHACHKTDNRGAVDGPKNFKGERTKHCGGALLFLIKVDAPIQMPFIDAMNDGRLDLKALVARAKADTIVFGSWIELAEYYMAAAQRILHEQKTDPPVCCVFAENYGDDPQMIRLSVAREQGLDILECCECGGPASTADYHWPYMGDRNFCIEHSGEGIQETVMELGGLLAEVR